MTVTQLRSLLSNELPGERAHFDFLPIRGSSKKAIDEGAFYKESAVAILLFHDEVGRLKTLVTKRQEYNGTHSGQISFPGGKKEEQDNNLLETAKRECEEEIGISLSKTTSLIQLTQVYIPISYFLITPFVFYLEESTFHYRPQEREVKQIIEIDLIELFQEKSIIKKDVPYPNGLILPNIPHFQQEETLIWGATALILNELKYLLLNR